MVKTMKRGGKKVIFFVLSNCQFIFLPFVEGNMVSAVACLSCIQKYRLSNAVMAGSVVIIIISFLVSS